MLTDSSKLSRISLVSINSIHLSLGVFLLAFTPLIEFVIDITNKIISAILLGMRAGIGAIIVSVVYDMALSVMDEHKERNILIMIGAFVLNYFLNVNIMYIILGCILLAFVELFIRRERS